ncbi:MAG: phosphate transport system regulatory protein PhoU [Planctomycetota bacterium]|jgi:phosphate transport system protein|nr:MAG: phosphate transport system regulatory protein PhoU [Planctomycetota bacterium]
MSVNLQSRVIDLRRNLLALGAVVEQRVMNVIDVIRDGDVELARIVRSGDAEIDQMQLDLEAECMRLLALGSPVAGDLRLILTAMRVSNELERIADMAKGISKRVIRLVDSGNYRYPSSLVQMAEAALNMLRDVLIAFSNEDIRLCLEVRRADAYVDNLNREVVAWAREWIEQDVEKSGAAIELLAIAQRVERLADIVTAIAEDTVFLVEGRLVRHGLE